MLGNAHQGLKLKIRLGVGLLSVELGLLSLCGCFPLIINLEGINTKFAEPPLKFPVVMIASCDVEEDFDDVLQMFIPCS